MMKKIVFKLFSVLSYVWALLKQWKSKKKITITLASCDNTPKKKKKA